jgi:hypothetical protein
VGKTYTLRVDGVERIAVEAYSSGPGAPIRSYVLRGGDRIERVGDEWTLERAGQAFWESRQVVTVEAI